MRLIFLSFVLFLSVNTSFGLKSNISGYKIRAVNRAVTITFKGKSYRLDVRKQIDAAKITETKLIFATEKNGFRYLVFDVGGWSRSVQNDRQCGAGIESNLIWVKLDAAWKITDVQSKRYESCWSGESLFSDFVTSADSLSVEYFGDGNTIIKLTYKTIEAEKGFQILTEPYKSK